jgi:FdhE protein
VAPTADDRWEARIARARRLATLVPAAAELLTFYADLVEAQRAFAPSRAERVDAVFESLASSLDREAVVSAIPTLLTWVRAHAPRDLATSVESMAICSSGDWQLRVDALLDGRRDSDLHRAFVVEAAVQPFAELVASRRRASDAAAWPASGRVCPFCASPPAVATLREAGHGARRSLLCGLCQTEWSVPRIGCTACGEAHFEKLPVFNAETIPAARIDACDSCRHYLKTIDFTRDGQVVPLVDDLATLSLDLWARDQGYRRLRPHMLGI